MFLKQIGVIFSDFADAMPDRYEEVNLLPMAEDYPYLLRFGVVENNPHCLKNMAQKIASAIDLLLNERKYQAI